MPCGLQGQGLVPGESEQGFTFLDTREVIFGWNQEPAPGLLYCFLTSPFFLHSLPFLFIGLLECALWNPGKVEEAE